MAKYCDWLDLGDASRVLDVGCGDGTTVRVLADKGVEAVGVDLRPSPWPEGPSFVLGDGSCLPFRDGSFDAVGSFTVLEHLTDPERFIRESVRVLRPGGRIVVASPNLYGSILLHPGHALSHRGGLPRYARNFLLHLGKWARAVVVPRRVGFDLLRPDVSQAFPGATDYDAVCAADPSVVRAVLRRNGVRPVYQSPSLEYSSSRIVGAVTKALEVLPLLRDLFGGVFIVGRRGDAPRAEAARA